MFTRDSVIISHNIKTPLTSISRAVGNILQLTYGQLIKSLFSNGEQGFFYDPNDLSTMFQDAAGTTPVTAAEQPVGLMLDKSKGLALGPNQMKFPNAEGLPAQIYMPDGTHSWGLNTIAPISGTQDSRLIVTVPSSSPSRPSLLFNLTTPLVAGKLYKFSFKYKVNSDVPIIQAVYKGDGTVTIPVSKGLLSGTGTFETNIRWFAGGQTAPYIYFSNANVFDVQLDEFVIQEVLGNHAIQTTTAARPILQDVPKRIDFDAVDDKLTTNLPAQLTGCTVIRAVPNVGTQILTNQTIPTTYNDNKDHCGLIVINRALTASETSQITKLFNKAARV